MKVNFSGNVSLNFIKRDKKDKREHDVIFNTENVSVSHKKHDFIELTSKISGGIKVLQNKVASTSPKIVYIKAEDDKMFKKMLKVIYNSIKDDSGETTTEEFKTESNVISKLYA